MNPNAFTAFFKGVNQGQWIRRNRLCIVGRACPVASSAVRANDVGQVTLGIHINEGKA